MKPLRLIWSVLRNAVDCLRVSPLRLAVLLEHVSHTICVRSFAAWMDSVLVFQWNSISLYFLSEWQTRRRYSVTTTARWMIAYRSWKFQPYAQLVSCGFCNWFASLLRSYWKWRVVAHIEEFGTFKSYRVTNDWFHIRNSLAVCRKALSFNCWNAAHRNVRKMMNMYHMSVRLSIFPWASWYMHILCLNQKSSMVSVASTILHGCFCMPLSFVVGSFIRPSVCLMLWSPHLWWLFYSFCGGCLCPPELRFTHFVFFLISDSICRIFINAERTMWTHANITYDAFIVSTSCVCSSACLSVWLYEIGKYSSSQKTICSVNHIHPSSHSLIPSPPKKEERFRDFCTSFPIFIII